MWSLRGWNFFFFCQTKGKRKTVLKERSTQFSEEITSATKQGDAEIAHPCQVQEESWGSFVFDSVKLHSYTENQHLK